MQPMSSTDYCCRHLVITGGQWQAQAMACKKQTEENLCFRQTKVNLK